MKWIRGILFITQIGLSSMAFAQDGCFYMHENRYLNVGAMRYDETGDRLCSKLPNGEYVWVNANEFDKSGGCWYVDKYPVGAIIDMVGTLKQCTISTDGLTEWVLYKN